MEPSLDVFIGQDLNIYVKPALLNRVPIGKFNRARPGLRLVEPTPRRARCDCKKLLPL